MLTSVQVLHDLGLLWFSFAQTLQTRNVPADNILLQDTCCLELYSLSNLWFGYPSSHQVLYLTTSKAMIAFTSIQPSRRQVLVEPVPNRSDPRGSISKVKLLQLVVRGLKR